MVTLVSVKVAEVGMYSVTRCGDRYYVLDPAAKEVGDCVSLDAAVGLAELFAHSTTPPEEFLAQELGAIDQAPESR